MNKFIERLTVKNYGCVKDVSVELTPLHAFIGPNDSGKSTLLRALRTLVQLAGDSFERDKNNVIQPFDPGELLNRLSTTELEAYWQSIKYDIRIDKRQGDLRDSVTINGKENVSFRSSLVDKKYGVLRQGNNSPSIEAREFYMRGARMIRLDPDALRQPSSLIARGDKLNLQDERGFGLPGVYDLILNRNMDAFLEIRQSVCRLFSSVKSIGLDNVSDSTKIIQVQLVSGEWVPARYMSEGLLYYLAFAAIPYLEPPAVILLEEPENGLHPARIAEVMCILREVSKTTQVIIATHSPLVINEMKPEEVSIVTRPPEKGTQIVRIDKTPDFKDRAKVYALGELWLSYADGEYESPLLDGGPRP